VRLENVFFWLDGRGPQNIKFKISSELIRSSSEFKNTGLVQHPEIIQWKMALLIFCFIKNEWGPGGEALSHWRQDGLHAALSDFCCYVIKAMRF